MWKVWIPCEVINSLRIRNGLVCLTDLRDEDPVHMYSSVFQDGNFSFNTLTSRPHWYGVFGRQTPRFQKGSPDGFGCLITVIESSMLGTPKKMPTVLIFRALNLPKNTCVLFVKISVSESLLYVRVLRQKWFQNTTCRKCWSTCRGDNTPVKGTIYFSSSKNKVIVLRKEKNFFAVRPDVIWNWTGKPMDAISLFVDNMVEV